MNTRAQKIAKLKSKEYRDAFIGSQISVGLPFQIRALREQKAWKQSDLAEKTGMLQPRISAIESPGGAKFTIETLRRLASAFDVALMVKFIPFSELVDWSERFSPDSFVVPDFNTELKELEVAAGGPQIDEETIASAVSSLSTNTRFVMPAITKEDAIIWLDELPSGNVGLAGSIRTQTPVMASIVGLKKAPNLAFEVHDTTDYSPPSYTTVPEHLYPPPTFAESR